MEKNPYAIIKCRHVTEKSEMLSKLAVAQSNASLKRCETPKFVFIVDSRANKQEIAWAIEKIYAKNNVKVTAVNTINVKSRERRVRGRLGRTSSFKKAIVSLSAGNKIDET